MVMPTFQPVVRAEQGPFSGAALVGTNTILLGWDIDPTYDRKGLLGFAVRRASYDPDTGEMKRMIWLSGQKRFKDQDTEGPEVSSAKAPFQRFRWSDYTVRANYAYQYEIFPVLEHGQSTRLLDPVRLWARPSLYDQDHVGVYVNRGVTSAHAYLTEFHNVEPSKVPNGAAYRWLSRSLRESLLEFIAAAGQGDGLHVAIYEFHDPEIASALKEALNRGVDVKIVYHKGQSPNDTAEESEHILSQAGLAQPAISIPRTWPKISHNKFVVRLTGGSPTHLWVGTTNFTEAGFYLQTNLALTFEQPSVADAYEQYFQILASNLPTSRRENPPRTPEQIQALSLSNITYHPTRSLSGVYFSPVRRDHIVDAAIELTREAKSVILLSTPFGMDARLKQALGQNPEAVVEYGLANSTATKSIEGLSRKNTRFFTPTRLETYMGKSWDARAFGKHKIHTKLMVIDPWGDTPAVLVGSANFSRASCRENDENAFLIKGDPRLAAIMATEFMRMFDHYKSRAFLNTIYAAVESPDRYLEEAEAWSNIYFNPSSRSYKFRDRQVFSGHE